jgi:hypothetical protein
MREYLSNHYTGRLPSFLSDFKQEDLAGRRTFAKNEEQFPQPRIRPLAIFQLHACDASAPKSPRATLPAAHFALELAEKTGEADLISWAQSGIGNVGRILTDYQSAEKRLKKARRIAVSPRQKGDATRRYALLLLTLANGGTKEIRHALSLFAKALQFSASSALRINSDRCYAVALHDKAIAHLTLGHLGYSAHIETGKTHLLEVMQIASPLHGSRSRQSAVFNLVRLHLKLDQSPPSELIEGLEAYSVIKSSMHGAMIQWLLIFDEIRRSGYSRGIRKRLLTVRNHLVQNQAWEYASQLTLAIAALDASQEKPGALPFLQKAESQAIIGRGHPTLVDSIMGAHYMAPSAIVGLAETAGAGNVHSMIAGR